MNQKKLFDLYLKEREYQRCCFGEYYDVKSFNLASFLNFIDTYLKKCQTAYSEKWDTETPPWLINCKEMLQDGSAPIQAYEDLIKVFALAGAALETFSDIDIDEWRRNPENDIRRWRE
jgi:hypothetical protein